MRRLLGGRLSWRRGRLGLLVPLAALAAAGELTGCVKEPAAPAAEDVRARLGGLDEARVEGVLRGEGHYLVTGHCFDPKNAGFELKVEAPTASDLTGSVLGAAPSQPIKGLDWVTTKAKRSIRMACMERQGEEIERRTKLIEQEIERIKATSGR
jgi:hypothetical protein